MSAEGAIAMAAAKCFALAATDLQEMDAAKQLEVGPLPEELFTTAKEMLASSAGHPPPEVQRLKPGEWTVVIAHEPRDTMAKYKNLPSEERMRYAFVTVPDAAASNGGEEPSKEPSNLNPDKTPGGVIIADMESFLEQVMTDNQGSPARQDLMNFWIGATKEIADEFGVCGKDEIASVLEVMPMYSKLREPRLEMWRKWSYGGR